MYEARMTVAVQLPASIRGPGLTGATAHYDVVRLMELGTTKAGLIAAPMAALRAHYEAGTAFNTAWEARLNQTPEPTPEEIAAHEADAIAQNRALLALNRAYALTVVQHIVVAVEGPPPEKLTTAESWDWVPLPLLLWLLEKGADKARDEIGGPTFLQ